MILLLSVIQAEETGRDRRLHVRLYNHARLPAEMLAQAREQAAAIYSRAGVELTWLECPVSPEEFDDFPVYCYPRRSDRSSTQPVVRREVAKARFSGRLLRLCSAGGGGRFPYYANIAAHRLGALADSSSADPAAILGCILAHEIGHLLLGVGSHSGKGIMTANWSGETLLLADQRRLRFTPKQGRRIRRNVDQRCIADSSRTSPRGKSDRTKKRYRPFL